ncbi:MAG: aminotransferase class V-fold PLP-dependent enzyme [Bryobacterales bacterium]|nr:aminotransferase class V-fold PLP-dependent enzyme [Bryobacterales bacterium]
MRRRDLLSALAVPAALPTDTLFRKDAERYWLQLRKEQFLLPDSRAFMNNGSLGVTPRPVLKAVEEYMENAAALTIPEYEYPRWGYESLDSQRTIAAAFLGCRKEDLAFTHNATEALSTIAAGIDLKPGDEVLSTDQEHPSGRAGWLLKQARYGNPFREVPMPIPPASPDALADALLSAIGPRTRVLFFSGILSATGLVMPVRKICDAARAKGLITVVDGAHVNGQIPLRLDEMGCDYYAGSPHKWMFAPAGSGILYGRPEMLERLWPSIVTGGWDRKQDHAERFMKVGTNNRAIIEGMVAGIRFGNEIGWPRIYDRIHSLARTARARAAALPYVKLLTPDNDALYGSLISIDLDKKIANPFMAECERRKIWIVRGTRIRVSSHIHTRPQDIDAFFGTLEEVAKKTGV